jgi:2OG-Fe(II) oxygenase superfamily
MMTVLRSGWTRRCVLQHEPYTWLATRPDQIYAEATARQLLIDFPVDSFTRTDASADGRAKTYRNYTRTLLAPSESRRQPEHLPPLWRQLVTELSIMDYRRDVAALLDQPVASTLEIRLVRHGNGDWLSPHTDREDKLFSHVFYFNPGWREEWGGCLEILAGAEPVVPVARVVPRLGVTSLLARCEKSWHQVTKVTEAAPGERVSLLVHGMR